MHELVRTISERTGLDEGQSTAAAEAAVGFLRERLPEPARGMVDQALSDEQGSGMLDQAADAAKGSLEH